APARARRRRGRDHLPADLPLPEPRARPGFPAPRPDGRAALEPLDRPDRSRRPRNRPRVVRPVGLDQPDLHAQPAVRSDEWPRPPRLAAARGELRRPRGAAAVGADAAGELLVPSEFAPGSREQALVDLVREHAAPLQRRLRDGALVELARRLIALEPPRGGYTEPQELAVYAVRMARVVRELEEELVARERSFAAFEERWFARPGERERRDLLAADIAATVTDPLERRADLHALDRFLDHDALRERHVVARHRLLARIELALSFIGRAAAAALGHRAAKPDELMHTLFSAGKVDELLRARGEKGARWQVRHVAYDAL